jgi:hypothetical protein
MKKFTTDEVIVLLGAGASCNAGILNSAQMIKRIEDKLNDDDWRNYRGLYNYIKSVHFQKQISKGNSPYDIGFNIEDLVSLVDIIVGISNSEIETYTFVGSWEKDLQPFIFQQRENKLVSVFKESIIKELRGEWLMPNDWIRNSGYYKRLIDFKNELEFPLKIFSLNYDLCLEQNLKDVPFEIGFDENNIWSFRKYDYSDINKEVGYYLYKLHGSINWKKTKEERLIKTEGDIKTDDLAIIFGISNKLQSYDPYLFYFYEFRERCLDANLIVCSGYGFMDEHINDVIKQGIKDNNKKRIIVNVFEQKKENNKIAIEIADKLKITSNQIIIYNKEAEKFFKDDFKLANFESLFIDESGTSLPANF